MREIKFRAWDKTLKKIYKVINIGLEREDTCRIEDKNKAVFVILSSELELMQYTGLKDKNGKEIYEGDIVKSGKRNFEIVFSSCLADRN